LAHSGAIGSFWAAATPPLRCFSIATQIRSTASGICFQNKAIAGTATSEMSITNARNATTIGDCMIVDRSLGILACGHPATGTLGRQRTFRCGNSFPAGGDNNRVPPKTAMSIVCSTDQLFGGAVANDRRKSA
jgi:hypothetical protein